MNFPANEFRCCVENFNTLIKWVYFGEFAFMYFKGLKENKIRGLKELQKLAVIYLTMMYVRLYTVELLEGI